MKIAPLAGLGSRGARARLCSGRDWGSEGRTFMAALALLRRLAVSFGIGTTSYIIMLGIMVLSVVYDKEFEPVVTFAFNTGRGIVDAFDKLVSGSSWGQVAVNHLRERVNMTHVVLSLPAI